MEKVRTEHSGNFTVQGSGRRGPDGRYIATYVVTEAQAGGEVEIKRSTGITFADEHEAAEAGFEAGKQWLEDYRPPNEWEGKK